MADAVEAGSQDEPVVPAEQLVSAVPRERDRHRRARGAGDEVGGNGGWIAERLAVDPGDGPGGGDAVGSVDE